MGIGQAVVTMQGKRAVQRRVGGNVCRPWRLAGLAGWAVHPQAIHCDKRPHTHTCQRAGA